MNLHSESCRRIAIAVCVFAWIAALSEGNRTFGGWAAYFSNHVPAASMMEGLHNLLDFLSKIGIPFVSALAMIALGCLLAGLVREWSLQSDTRTIVFTPRVVLTVGWLIFVPAAIYFAYTLFEDILFLMMIHNQGMPVPGDIAGMVAGNGASLLLTGVHVAIGWLLVRGGAENERLSSNAPRGLDAATEPLQ